MSQQQTSHPHTNHLIHENSPYLLQHAHNPVDWYPWDKEALEKAKKENKLMIISIGYAACHWCHVMEHESFEDSTVAGIMNDHFVNIKVDREERPDIDDVYMTACQLVSQRGCGWPLNAFALPDGRPVWAGTYFPKDQWMNVLNQFQKMWEEEPEKLNEYAEQLTQGIKQQEEIVLGKPQALQKDHMHAMANNLINRVDKKHGGREGAPKFPMPSNYLYLLNYHKMTGVVRSLEAVETTLQKMAYGGIYDQLGGGFARYSVDAVWLVPHFEKMLYDNGQLLNLYSSAYQVTGNELYKTIAYEIVDWLDREMTDSSGGFYSSLDADSEGEEGKFYVWTTNEVDALLTPEEAKVIRNYYNLEDKGNWEHEKNILHRQDSDETVARELDLSLTDLTITLKSAKEKLFRARALRVRPGLDDKVLTSWNALMLRGLVQAYRATQDQSFLDRALRNGAFIRREMLKEDYRLDRNYKDGTTKINAFLDDYAFVIESFISLYQATFDESWLNDAKALTDYTIEHFYDEDSKFFFYTSNLDDPLVARKKELGDNVIPGSNSAMARNLNFLSHYYYQNEYESISDQMLFNMIDPVVQSKQTSFYSNWALLFLEKIHPTYEIAIVGPDFQSMASEFQSHFLSNTIYLGGSKEGSLELLKDKLQPGQTTIYVCQNRVCQLPVVKVDEALRQIKYLED